MNLKELCSKLELKIQNAYESGTTMEEAEKLAAEFLYAQIKVSDALKTKDLDARMKKSGVKAIKAAIYMHEATKDAKKPSDVMLAALVDQDTTVLSEQTALDTSEVERDALERYYNIFLNAHVHFRNVSKGRFE